MGNETHKNLLQEKFNMNTMINKVRNEVTVFIHAHVTLEYLTLKGRMNLKGLLSTSIASAITAIKLVLEEMRSIHIWIVMIIPLRARSISEHIPTSSAYKYQIQNTVVA